MGRNSSHKREMSGTSYHRLMKESRNERGVHYHQIGNNENMCLNPLKHIIRGIPYKNTECQKLLLQTLQQYRAFMESIEKQNNKENI